MPLRENEKLVTGGAPFLDDNQDGNASVAGSHAFTWEPVGTTKVRKAESTVGGFRQVLLEHI